MNPLTSAKAWTGGLSAGLFAEYAKPIVDWGIYKASLKLEACCTLGMPDPVQQSVSVIVMAAVVGAVIHWTANKKPAEPAIAPMDR